MSFGGKLTFSLAFHLSKQCADPLHLVVSVGQLFVWRENLLPCQQERKKKAEARRKKIKIKNKKILMDGEPKLLICSWWSVQLSSIF